MFDQKNPKKPTLAANQKTTLAPPPAVDDNCESLLDSIMGDLDNHASKATSAITSAPAPSKRQTFTSSRSYPCLLFNSNSNSNDMMPQVSTTFTDTRMPDFNQDFNTFDNDPLPEPITDEPSKVDQSEQIQEDQEFICEPIPELTVKIKSIQSSLPTIAVPTPQFVKPTVKPATTDHSQDPRYDTCRDWTSVKQNINKDRLVDEIPVSSSSYDCFDDEGSLRLFWIDACENNGIVYLFGKVSF